MQAALAITAKDLRQKVRDRSAIILAVVAPLTLAFLFSVMLPDGSSFSARYVVVDLDGGPVAAGLVGGPLAGLQDTGAATLVTLASEQEARAAVERGEADAAVVIPAGLSEAVEAAEPAELRIIGDVDSTLATQVASAIVTGYASEIEAVQLAVATAIGSSTAPPDAGRVAELAQAALAMSAPVVVADDRIAVGAASNATYFAASMAVLFVFFAVQFGVLSLLAERRHGTLARMLAAPILPRTILLGKMGVSVALGVLSMGILAIATSLLTGARWGDPLAVAALIGAMVLAASGICLLIVGFARTEEQASGLTAIVAMVLAAVGGSFFPLSQAPDLLAQLSVLTPHAWFLRGIDELSGGASIEAILPALAVLLAIALVAGSIGMLRARRVVMSG